MGKVDHHWGAALAPHQRGFMHYAQGEYNLALEPLQERADLFHEQGDDIGAAFASSLLGNAAASAGEYATADAALTLGAIEALKQGNTTVLAMCWGGFTAVVYALVSPLRPRLCRLGVAGHGAHPPPG